MSELRGAVWAIPGPCRSGQSQSEPRPAHIPPSHMHHEILAKLESSRARKVVAGPDAVALGCSCYRWRASQIQQRDPPTHRVKPGQGWVVLLPSRVGWNSPGPAKPQMAGCSSCFLDPRLGHGPREGWFKGRKDYGLPAHCSPNHSVAKTGKDR